MWSLSAWAGVAGETLEANLASDGQYRLWQVSVQQGQLLLVMSPDAGKHFSPAIRVAKDDSLSSPQVAFAGGDQVYVAWWSLAPETRHSQLWLARSDDGGHSFSAPQSLHETPADFSVRALTLYVTAQGEILLAWLQPHAPQTVAAQLPFAASMQVLRSIDAGKTFQWVPLPAGRALVCAGLAVAEHDAGRLGLLWQQGFEGNTMALAMAELDRQGVSAPVRASFSPSAETVCATHGMTLAAGDGFGYHLAYIESQGRRPGLHVVRMDYQAWVTSPPKRLADAGQQPDAPVLYSQAAQVWLAWRETTPQGVSIWQTTSVDGGKSWATPVLIMGYAEQFSRPQWLALEGQVHLCATSAANSLQCQRVSPAAEH